MHMYKHDARRYVYAHVCFVAFVCAGLPVAKAIQVFQVLKIGDMIFLSIFLV